MRHTAGMRERLTPPWWVFVVGAIFPVMLGVAYGAAFGFWLGAGVIIAGTALVSALLIRTSAIVTVTPSGDFIAGRATLPQWAIGAIEVVDTQTARERLRTDGSAYLVMRSWHSGSVLVVTVQDDHDPHSRWYVSTRYPEALTLALQAR